MVHSEDERYSWRKRTGTVDTRGNRSVQMQVQLQGQVQVQVHVHVQVLVREEVSRRRISMCNASSVHVSRDFVTRIRRFYAPQHELQVNMYA